MNQIVDAGTLVSAVPLDKPAAVKMTRSQKLLHWAGLVRKFNFLRIYHNLEHYPADMLAAPIDGDDFAIRCGTPGLFGVALNEPVFREQGLVGSPSPSGPVVSPRNIMDFFELSQAELHEFSCYCGGRLTGPQIAERMVRLAGVRPFFLGRVAGALGL
jgi:hypothetical protein